MRAPLFCGARFFIVIPIRISSAGRKRKRGRISPSSLPCLTQDSGIAYHSRYGSYARQTQTVTRHIAFHPHNCKQLAARGHAS